MKKLFLLFTILASASQLFATAAASGKLNFPNTLGATPGYALFVLENCGGNYPEVSGASITPRVQFTLAADGTWSGTLYRNDEISCNAAFPTFWHMTYFVSGLQVGPARDFICSQSTCVFDGTGGLTPITVYPPPTPPAQPLTGAQSVSCTFTSASTWTCANSLNTAAVIVDLYDAGGNQLIKGVGSGPTNVTTAVNSVVATFASPTSGTMYVVNAGNWTPSVASPNNIIANPNAPQSINSQPFTFNGPVSFLGGIPSNNIFTGSNTFSGATLTKTLEGTLYADQWCTTPGTLDQSCIQNAINSKCSALTSGQTAYVSIFAPAGVYTFSSSVTIPGAGFCRIDVSGEHTAAVGGTEFLAANNTTHIFDWTSGQADSGAIHHIWFQSQGSQGTATNDAIKIGKSGGQTMFDFYIEDSWFNGFNKAVDCINCSGVTLLRNSLELNNYGFYCAPASTDKCNSLIFNGNRWFENGLGIANAGAVYCDNTSGSANVGNLNITGGIMDVNGNFTAGLSGFAIKLVNGCNVVNITGIDFHDQTFDDINLSNVRDITITGNTSNNTASLFLDGFDAQGATITGNSIGKTDVSNLSTHGVIRFVVSSATCANNVVSSNVSSFTGSTTATSYLFVGSGCTGTTAGMNLYPSLTQSQLYGSVTDASAQSIMFGKLQAGTDTNGVTVLAVGQLTQTNPKQFTVVSNPTSNTQDLQAVQTGLAFNQGLRLQPSGGGLLPFFNSGSAINGNTCSGQCVAAVLASTSQKAETGTADANVLTYNPAAVAGTYRVCFTTSVSSATAGVIGWTLSYTDSSGNGQVNVAQSLFQTGTAAPALTFTTNAATNYQSCSQIDISNSAANIIVKWVGGGTTAAKVSATVERII